MSQSPPMTRGLAKKLVPAKAEASTILLPSWKRDPNNTTDEPKAINVLRLIFHRISVVKAFHSLKEEITPKMCMLCF